MHAVIPRQFDPMDDRDIVALQLANPEWRVELSGDGHVIFSPLTGTATGPNELEPAVQLASFARVAGGKAFGAAAGFRLPDKSLFGPDAAWISPERLALLTAEDKDTAFWPICPDVMIEVMSEWDTWNAICEKVLRYERNGARYAVAVDSKQRRVFERGTPPAGLALDFNAIFEA